MSVDRPTSPFLFGPAMDEARFCDLWRRLDDDKRTWDEFAAMARPALIEIAGRLGAGADAQEAVQTVLTALVVKARRPDATPIHRPVAYLSTALRHALGRLRSRKRATVEDVTAVESAAEAPERGARCLPPNVLEDRDLAERWDAYLRNALRIDERLLPPEQAVVDALAPGGSGDRAAILQNEGVRRAGVTKRSLEQVLSAIRERKEDHETYLVHLALVDLAKNGIIRRVKSALRQVDGLQALSDHHHRKYRERLRALRMRFDARPEPPCLREASR